MKSNVLFKFLVPPIILAVLLIIFVFQPSSPQSRKVKGDGLMLSREEARELGIEGDTPEETLRTLVGELRNMRSQLETANIRSDKLQTHNENLEKRSREWENQLNDAVAQAAKDATSQAKAESERLTERLMGMMSDLEVKVSTKSSMSDIPIGLGLDNMAGKDAGDHDTVLWVEPSDAVETKPGSSNRNSPFAFPSSFKNPLDGSIVDRQQREGLAALGESQKSKPKRNDEVTEVFTIAENSTLLGSTTMTALIGRVPVDGTVNDPYPFKVLIGKENLAANGFELPEISGAVMAGTAQGDWTLSCVRGQVETITFIFEDGTVRTVPEPEKVQRNRTGRVNNNAAITGGIGYISDPYGIPCIAGDRKSNAKEYIKNNSLITAAGAAIARIFSKDSSVQVTSSGTTITDNNQAFNAILQQGVGDIQEWVTKMYGQAFAAVYVPPHQEVAVHIDRELEIDFEKFGRKVRHNEDIKEIVWLD